MLAADRSRAGGLTIVVAGLALASCGSAPMAILPIPGMGGGSAPSPRMEPGLIRASVATADSERPSFFVQWRPGLPGLTRRPKMHKDTALPVYPPEAVREEQAGITTLESCLTTDGRLVDTHLMKSSGSKLLDEATLKWAKTARYEPAEFNGEPFAICGYQFDYKWQVDVVK